MDSLFQIKFPDGSVYEIEDRYARQVLAGGLQFVICWDGQSTPVVANIPAGVKVTYNEAEYTGTMAASAAEPLTFYLVYSPTQVGEGDHYDEYVAIGATGNKHWEKIGDTRIDLSSLGALAYKDNVVLNKGNGAQVLGSGTTFANAASNVSFAPHTTDKVLGADTTFKATVTPSKTNIKATASNVSVGASATDNFVKSYPGATSKMVKDSVSGVASKSDVSIPNVTENAGVTIPNVTSVGSPSNWAFAAGTGADAGTLIISGGNGSAPTLGTALEASKVTLGTPIEASKVTTESKSFATGALSAQGAGDAVMTGLGNPTTAAAVTGVQVTAQPVISLAKGAAAGEGVIEVADGISSATAGVDTSDEVTAITQLGAGTAAAQTITVTKDEKKVALYDDLGVTVS